MEFTRKRSRGCASVILQDCRRFVKRFLPHSRLSTPSRLSLDRGGPRAIVKTFSRLLHVKYVNASPGSVLDVEGSALPGPSLSFFPRALLPRLARQGRISGIIREPVQRHIIPAYTISPILSTYLVYKSNKLISILKMFS